MILLLFLYGTKSREKNGPNSQPAQCISPSEFYKNGYIQSIGERLLDLWWFDGLPLVTFLFICSKLHFEFLQASSD